MASDDLRVGADHLIPAAELHWTFGPSGGPGGQHANRAHTRAELAFDLAASAVFDPGLKRRMLDQIRHTNGVVREVSDESRSQWRNRQIARRRLAERLAASMRQQPVRRPTTPSRAQRRRRLDAKRRRSDIKRLRRRPDLE